MRSSSHISFPSRTRKESERERSSFSRWNRGAFLPYSCIGCILCACGADLQFLRTSDRSRQRFTIVIRDGVVTVILAKVFTERIYNNTTALRQQEHSRSSDARQYGESVLFVCYDAQPLSLRVNTRNPSALSMTLGVDTRANSVFALSNCYRSPTQGFTMPANHRYGLKCISA